MDLGRRHREVCADVGYLVVVAGRQRPLEDGVRPDAVAGLAGQSAGDAVSPEERGVGVGQRRVAGPKDLRLRLGADDERGLSDLELLLDGADVVPLADEGRLRRPCVDVVREDDVEVVLGYERGVAFAALVAGRLLRAVVHVVLRRHDKPHEFVGQLPRPDGHGPGVRHRRVAVGGNLEPDRRRGASVRVLDLRVLPRPRLRRGVLDCRAARRRGDVNRDAETLSAVGPGRACRGVVDLGRRYREVCPHVGYLVVVARRQRPLKNGVRADGLARFACQCAGYLVRSDEGGIGVGQRRVAGPEDLRLRLGADDERGLAYLELLIDHAGVVPLADEGRLRRAGVDVVREYDVEVVLGYERGVAFAALVAGRLLRAVVHVVLRRHDKPHEFVGQLPRPDGHGPGVRHRRVAVGGNLEPDRRRGASVRVLDLRVLPRPRLRRGVLDCRAARRRGDVNRDAETLSAVGPGRACRGVVDLGRRYREVRTDVCDLVVVAGGQRPLEDGVCTDGLVIVAGQRAGDPVRSDERGVGVGQRRVAGPEDLRLRLGTDDQRRLPDIELLLHGARVVALAGEGSLRRPGVDVVREHDVEVVLGYERGVAFAALVAGRLLRAVVHVVLRRHDKPHEFVGQLPRPDGHGPGVRHRRVAVGGNLEPDRRRGASVRVLDLRVLPRPRLRRGVLDCRAARRRGDVNRDAETLSAVGPGRACRGVADLGGKRCACSKKRSGQGAAYSYVVRIHSSSKG